MISLKEAVIAEGVSGQGFITLCVCLKDIVGEVADISATETRWACQPIPRLAAD